MEVKVNKKGPYWRTFFGGYKYYIKQDSTRLNKTFVYSKNFDNLIT